jgi:hypothetical protein
MAVTRSHSVPAAGTERVTTTGRGIGLHLTFGFVVDVLKQLPANAIPRGQGFL